MLQQISAFFETRFLQPRQSTAVSGSSAPYLHAAQPIWAHALPSMPAFERVLPNGTKETCTIVDVAGCSGTFSAPSNTQRYEVLFPFRGTFSWYELAHAAVNFPPKTISIACLTDAVYESINITQRATVGLDMLVMYPTPLNETSAGQSLALGAILGHLREAAAYANAELRGGVEMPYFTTTSEEMQVPSEYIALRFRLIIPETILKSTTYGLQMQF